MLSIEVVSASNLKNLERIGKSDPYVKLKFQGQEKKTKVVDNNLNPEWGETLEFPVAANLSGGESLELTVMDKETLKDRMMGKASISLAQAIRSGQQAFPAQKLVDKSSKSIQGSVNLTIRYQAPQKGGGGGGGGGGGASQDTEDTGGGGGDMGGDPDDPDGGDMGGGMDGEGGDEGGDGGEGDGEGGTGAMGDSKGLKSSKSAKSRAAKYKNRQARDNLPNKELDFQLRIHCIEARRLAGGGGSISPCCTVSCNGKSKSTASVKSSTNPVWDETLVYNFKVRPKELFDSVVVMKVVNSKFSMKDSLIGNFKLDVGAIYDEPEHGFLQKWVLLTTDKDIGSGGTKGYLKISVGVVGPGDDPKPFPAYDSSSAHIDDIDANLLRPSGVRLQPATFKIRVFRAEDVPQMDAAFMQSIKTLFGKEGDEQKDLVDPYVQVSYAGHKISSGVKFTTCNPEWNEQINMGVRFPSMCERVRVRLYDYDRVGRDDTAGTSFLLIPRISLPGDDGGFLPTFGPAWINFYGSTREYKDFSDQYDHLNKGVQEGVAFRGRVLLQLNTELGKYPSKQREDIPAIEHRSILKTQRRFKHRLFVAFFHATQVKPHSNGVEFEVSMGSYGYREDPNAPPSSSITQDTKPVSDGGHYHFLPWDDKKPCCVIPCQWEDNTYRIESLNILLHIADELEKKIKGVKDLLREGKDVSPDKVAQAVINMLENLVSGLNEPLPVMSFDGATELDILWGKYREGEVVVLKDEIYALRQNATEVEEAVEECVGFLNRIRAMAVETQISIPDLIIWMIHDNDRVAVARIPASEIFYSPNPMAKGLYCGKVHTRFLKQPVKDANTDASDRVGSQIRFAAWIGREEQTDNWEECIPGGTVVTFAETYENQIFHGFSWGTTFCPVPDWSDNYGEMTMTKESFETPKGWRWDGDWFIASADDIDYDPELKMREIQEETYEVVQRSEDDQDWENIKVTFEDDSGMEYQAPQDIKCPDGWVWKDGDWNVDTNRMVDQDGWEYSNDPESRDSFQPMERGDSTMKRRRIVRLRIRAIESPELKAKVKAAQKNKETQGWEFSIFHGGPYYRIEKRKYVFRRRRWLRKMVANDKSAPCIFKFKGTDTDDDKKKSKKDKKAHKKAKKKALLQSPRMYMHFVKEHKWILRAYIYQARALLSGDKSGLADPYAIISFVNKSKKTHTIKSSVCPTWDETVDFKDIPIFGEPETTLGRPPLVVVEFFDKDLIGKNELMGRTFATPEVRLGAATEPTRLKWYTIFHQSLEGGELLAAFELILMDGKNEHELEIPPLSKDAKHHLVPFSVRPKLVPMRVEALAWGVRDMKKFELISVEHPLLRLVCGNYLRESDPIEKCSDNPNFSNPCLHMDCMLPKEQIYMPPLEIQILDKRPFGRTPIVGVHTIKSLEAFVVPTPGSKEAEEIAKQALRALSPRASLSQDNSVTSPKKPVEPETLSPAKPKPKGDTAVAEGDEAITIDSEVGTQDPDTQEDEFDFWSRYYSTIGDEKKSTGFLEKGFEPMTYYDKEIEHRFKHFRDRTKDFLLSRGKAAERDAEACGLFKGDVKVYYLNEEDQDSVPLLYKDVTQSGLQEVTVRVYIIKGKNLAPQDPNGKSDPYIKIMLGEEEVIDDKEHYIPNNLNPLFGKMFEFDARLPQQHEMKIVIMDHDFGSADDLIGHTIIDLENRLLSKYMATCGLPLNYFVAGPSKWRHHLVPSALLEKYVKAEGHGDVQWTGNTQVLISGITYCLDDFEGDELFSKVKDKDERKNRKRELGGPKQRLALYVLNQFEHCPDHIEQRKLVNPIQGELPQGYIDMFVDIFPKGEGSMPPPIDITPRKPQDMFLRIVVWNTKDVILDERAIIGGDRMSDIYVKAFLRGQDKSKKTDVHYRSMDGQGMFNWRLVFPFRYLPAEQEIVIKKKEHFWNIEGTEKRLDPILVLQVWDNDLFSADDVLGSVEFNLTRFFKPVTSARRCSVNQVSWRDDLSNCDNLFKRKRMKGWWPVIANPDGNNPEITGKVEMELEILTADDAELKPAGEAQLEPNANPFLEKPNRPATSFPFFLSPWKSFKYIIWKHYKWWIILAIFLVILILLIVIIAYSTPNYIVQFAATFLASKTP